MTGTIINIIAVLIGGSLGMLFGARLPERLKQTVTGGMGLFTAAIGVQMFLKTGNPLIVLGSVLIGALLGEWWRIEEGLQSLGQRLEKRFARSDSAEASQRFVRGFLVSSLLFCVGPMTILGSIQDGLTGDYSLLAVKSVLDGFAALAFASTLGVGVLFSTLVILAYQGGISLLAAQLSALVTEPMMTEMTAAGGVILMGLAISSLLEIKPLRVGNFLPALAVAPSIVWLLTWWETVIAPWLKAHLPLLF
ncbi:MAG: DUF554 domain-containing protein [Anaerolineae bacterium]|nr:MAG: DUF554 domain-containing protein [Anaerolineae bacterium]